MSDEPLTDRATSFGTVAGTYARARPGYPDDAVDWLVEGLSDGADVADVGAGTGAFTRSLVARGCRVVAVEPSEGMRTRLSADLPDVTVLDGAAERLPLPDACVDAAFFAQAWHWVDAERALPELARVIRPGGRLALVWNARDEREPWVAELGALLRRHGSAMTAVGPRGLESARTDFGSLESFETTWAQPMTAPRLVDLVMSRSYAIAASEPERAQLGDEVEELTRQHPALAGQAEFELPYVTRCWRVTRHVC